MNLPEFSLKGKKALVTGGRRGIGKNIALAFAEAGADLAVADLIIDDGELDNVAKEIQKLGRRSLAVQVDTSNKSKVQTMVDAVNKSFGGIDILLNNAGVMIKGPILDLTEDDWDKTMNVNLKGYFLVAQAAGKIMAAQKKGAIINISSAFAFNAVPAHSIYCISKVGVVILTKSLAKELGPFGVRANSIAPGLTQTELSKSNWQGGDTLKAIEQQYIMGRIGHTADMVGAALFLASEASSYINGETIVVDGGGRK